MKIKENKSLLEKALDQNVPSFLKLGNVDDDGITIINCNVIFIDEKQLIKEARSLPIEKIKFKHLVNREIVKKSEILILKKDGNYKIIKSRW